MSTSTLSALTKQADLDLTRPQGIATEYRSGQWRLNGLGHSDIKTNVPLNHDLHLRDHLPASCIGTLSCTLRIHLVRITHKAPVLVLSLCLLSRTRMPPATRSSTRKQATSVPSTRPKAKAKSKAKPKAKKNSAHQVSETQPSESSARPVPKTKSKKSITREKLLLVQSLRVKALSLMRQSNENTPISCLPVEILSAIFIEVSAAEYEAHKTTWARIHISR